MSGKQTSYNVIWAESDRQHCLTWVPVVVKGEVRARHNFQRRDGWYELIQVVQDPHEPGATVLKAKYFAAPGLSVRVQGDSPAAKRQNINSAVRVLVNARGQ